MTNTKIFIASDHAGFELKNKLIKFLTLLYNVTDLGPNEYDAEDDYPDYAIKLCREVIKNKNYRGILICGTGQGMDRVANKFPGIDAAVVWDNFSTKVAIEHGFVNILCFGQKSVEFNQAKEYVTSWLKSVPKIEERHKRRIRKIRLLEKELFK